MRRRIPLCLICMGDGVTHEVHVAALPCRAAQELDPGRLGLAVADRYAQHLAPAFGDDAHSDDDCG